MKKQRLIIVGLSFLGLLILVIKSEVMIDSVNESIKLCIYTVIPSLFPFMIIANVITNNIIGIRIPILDFLGYLCKVPKGLESIMLIGFLGGYPVGARNVYDAYYSGAISKNSAARMITFCNNAGPSFIFGILGGLFSKKTVLLMLWVIHIISAILVGISLPGSVEYVSQTNIPRNTSITHIVYNCVKSVSIICGWIIIFRVVIDMIPFHSMSNIPQFVLTLLKGLLELTNGCISLYSIDSEAARFIIGSFLLSFGGLCVTMQTTAVTNNLGMRKYIIGKLLQGAYSFLLACGLQRFLFNSSQQCHVPFAVCIFFIILCGSLTFYINQKKVVAFRLNMRYNVRKTT